MCTQEPAFLIELFHSLGCIFRFQAPSSVSPAVITPLSPGASPLSPFTTCSQALSLYLSHFLWIALIPPGYAVSALIQFHIKVDIFASGHLPACDFSEPCLVYYRDKFCSCHYFPEEPFPASFCFWEDLSAGQVWNPHCKEQSPQL